MQLTEIAEIILLILLVVCAVGVNFGKSLLQAVIIFMSYSSIMCILWVLLGCFWSRRTWRSRRRPSERVSAVCCSC